MTSSRVLFSVILGGVVGLGGVVQGWRWKSNDSSGDSKETKARLQKLIEERDILKRENESLRSVVQGGGEVAVSQEWISRVEKDCGMRFRSSPIVNQLSADKLKDRIGAAIESSYGEFGVDYRQEAYSLFGWITPGNSLLAQLTAARSAGAKGWFDPALGEAWVTDRFELQNIPDQALLVKLLTRILISQNFPPSQDYPGDDVARAREAVHQGAALAAETRFLAEKARTIGFVPLTGDADAVQIFASLPPFIQGVESFQANDGKGIVEAAYVQSLDVFKELIKNPPKSTAAILRNDFKTEETRLEIETSEEVFMTESAGLLGLRLWLQPLGEDRAVEISSAWKSDTYQLLPATEAACSLAWEIAFLTKEAADQFQAAALERVTTMADLKTPVQAEVEIHAPEHRILKVSRIAENRVRFTNSFSKAP